MLSVEKLIQLFNENFAESERTVLRGGGEEPFYHPADEQSLACVVFREDFVSSAMHEIAHWCIAGKERRKLADFGYWYEPDGRSVAQQQIFETVEIRPQALEWAFSMAAGIQFHFSADNLNNGSSVSNEFKMNVWHQCCVYLEQGLPKRAQRLFDALRQHCQADALILPPEAPC